MSMMELTNRIDAIVGGQGGRPKQGDTFSIILAEVKDIKDKENLNRVKCLPIGAKAGEEAHASAGVADIQGLDRLDHLAAGALDAEERGAIGGVFHPGACAEGHHCLEGVEAVLGLEEAGDRGDSARKAGDERHAVADALVAGDGERAAAVAAGMNDAGFVCPDGRGHGWEDGKMVENGSRYLLQCGGFVKKKTFYLGAYSWVR